MLRVVIDTNLFVSGTIIKQGTPYALLEEWRKGSFVLIMSQEQRIELEVALRKPEFAEKYNLTESEIAAILRRIDSTSLEVLIGPSPIEVRDKNDEMILATAVGGEADYLVTGDNDLLVLKDSPELDDLKIVTASEFLQILRQS